MYTHIYVSRWQLWKPFLALGRQEVALPRRLGSFGDVPGPGMGPRPIPCDNLFRFRFSGPEVEVRGFLTR